MQQRLFKYKRDPERLPSRQITERSLRILALVERFRLLSSQLIVRLISGNEDVTYKHLQTLYHRGLINRFAFPRIGNPSEFWYYLDSTAALDLLAEQEVTRLPSTLKECEEIKKKTTQPLWTLLASMRCKAGCYF